VTHHVRRPAVKVVATGGASPLIQALSFVEAPFHAAGILERRKMPFSVGARKVGVRVKVPRSNA
jgi:hypothetical protein